MNETVENKIQEATSSLAIHVLFRFSKRTGIADTTMVGMGSALMQMWALNNTSQGKVCMIFERESGKLVFASFGTKEGFPKVKRKDDCKGTCVDYGISLEDLHDIKDPRFDEEEDNEKK